MNRLLMVIALTALLVGVASYAYDKDIVQNVQIFFPEKARPEESFAAGTVLFGGDIMLGRSVEGVALMNGYTFPFAYIKDTVEKSDISIANFEAPVPREHERTPSLGMKFSVPYAALNEVKNSGFDIISLSNNHTLDHGVGGYVDTTSACLRAMLTCIGHPFRHSTSSMTTVAAGDSIVGILALHTLFEEPSTTTLSSLLHELKRTSDIQFVFIHWGDEYEPLHNASQETLAHFLIDSGVDAVIGHHPHVEQDIELYKGQPIFYSLGNLIFDQYFSKEVQQGFMVEAKVDEHMVTYALLPYELLTERTQPRFETGESETKRIASLMPRSLFSPEEIQNGSFSVLRTE